MAATAHNIMSWSGWNSGVSCTSDRGRDEPRIDDPISVAALRL